MLEKNIVSLEEENKALKAQIVLLKEQMKKLDEKVFDLYTISQAGKVFTATPDTTKLSEILLSMIVERIKMDKIALLLFDKKAGVFKLTQAIGINIEETGQIEYRPREGLFWQLIVSGEPFSVVDIEGNLRFSGIFNGSNLKLLNSSTWVPLKTKERVIGVITLSKKEINHEDLDFLTQLAGQAAVAFETALLYQELGAVSYTHLTLPTIYSV